MIVLDRDGVECELGRVGWEDIERIWLVEKRTDERTGWWLEVVMRPGSFMDPATHRFTSMHGLFRPRRTSTGFIIPAPQARKLLAIIGRFDSRPIATRKTGADLGCR